MSYCRFQNTLADLQDCWENMDDEDLSREEARARKRLLRLCQQIASEVEDEPENDEAERRQRQANRDVLD